MTREGSQVRARRITGVYRRSDDTHLLLETLSERARGARQRPTVVGLGRRLGRVHGA